MRALQVNHATQRMSEDGVLVLEGFFSDAELRPVSDEVNEIIAGRASYLPASEMVNEPGSNPPRLRNAFRMHLYSNLFRDFARHPGLVEIVREMLGGPLRLYGSQIFAKPASVGSEVPRHQDMAHWPFAPSEIISVWIALDDSTMFGSLSALTNWACFLTSHPVLTATRFGSSQIHESRPCRNGLSRFLVAR